MVSDGVGGPHGPACRLLCGHEVITRRHLLTTGQGDILPQFCTWAPPLMTIAVHSRLTATDKDDSAATSLHEAATRGRPAVADPWPAAHADKPRRAAPRPGRGRQRCPVSVQHFKGSHSAKKTLSVGLQTGQRRRCRNPTTRSRRQGHLAVSDPRSCVAHAEQPRRAAPQPGCGRQRCSGC